MFRGFSFNQDGIEEKINGVADYEAITFKGDSAYLLIEVENPMRSFIIQGLVNRKDITLFSETLTAINLKHDYYEIACEALIISDNKIYVFYEANGANINSNPQVFCFDLSLNKLDAVGFENIEYRIVRGKCFLSVNNIVRIFE